MAVGEIRALIFDFDGLMVDTEGPALESWQEIFAAHGCALPLSAWALCLGGSGAEFDPCAYLEEHSKRAINREAIRERRRQRKLELAMAQPLLPGVGEYIATARQLGLKLGVASSSGRQWVMGHLDRLGMSAHFDCVTCADDVTRVKPDPELYQTTLAVLDVRADQAVVLEDSPNGVLAAKRAGLFCIAVPNPITGQLCLDHADMRLTSLADVSLEMLLAQVRDHDRAHA
jgi:HAD superfamily hydrolase (TIGR01509 family)